MATEIVVGAVLAIFTSNLAVEIYKGWREDKKGTKVTKEDLAPLYEGVKELLGDALDKKFKVWQRSDRRTQEMWEEIESLYAPYRKLNGNGTREKQYNDNKDLPITE